MPIASKKPQPQVPSSPAAELARRPAPTPTTGRRLWIKGRSDIGFWVADTAHADGLWALRGFGRSRSLLAAGFARLQIARLGDAMGALHAMIREGRLEALDRLRKMSLRRGHVFAKRRLPYPAETLPIRWQGNFPPCNPLIRNETEKESLARREGPTTLVEPDGFRSGRNIAGFPGRKIILPANP